MSPHGRHPWHNHSWFHAGVVGWFYRDARRYRSDRNHTIAPAKATAAATLPRPKRIEGTVNPPANKAAPRPTRPSNAMETNEVVINVPRIKVRGPRAATMMTTNGIIISPPKSSAGNTRTSGLGHGKAKAQEMGTLCTIHNKIQVANRSPTAPKTPGHGRSGGPCSDLLGSFPSPMNPSKQNARGAPRRPRHCLTNQSPSWP